MGTRRAFLVDIFLSLVIVALYMLTSGGDAAAAMAELYAGPSYRGRAENAVSLEFAVSWDAAAVEDILDILSEHGAKATFSVSGEYALERPDMVLRMANEGHELATMGQRPERDGGFREIVRDVEASLNAIEQAAGVRPVLYYSGGRAVAPSSRAARKLGLVQILCTVDLRCASGTAEDIIERGLNEPLQGSIILLQPTRAAASALPGLINGLQAKGIRAVRVGDVLG